MIGIREVRYIEVRVEDSRHRGPRLLAPKLEVINLPREAWARLMQFRVTLPLHRGAGPCGTSLRSGAGASVLAWSIRHLLDPLASYYSTYEPPMRFGHQPAHRGKRAA